MGMYYHEICGVAQLSGLKRLIISVHYYHFQYLKDIISDFELELMSMCMLDT